MKSLAEYINEAGKQFAPIVHYGYEKHFLTTEFEDDWHYFLPLDKNDKPIDWDKINNKTREAIGRMVINNGSVFGCENEIMGVIRGCHSLAEVGTNHDVNNIRFVYRKTKPEWEGY